MKHTIVAALWMAGVLTALAAVPVQRSTPADARQTLLDDVASLNENFVEFAIDGDVKKIGETAHAIEAALPKLRTAIPAMTFAAIESRIRDQGTAVKAGNRIATALASVEIYRLLQEAIDPKTRVVPLQVALLDYAGFKILCLTKGNAVEWADVNATVKEAVSFWKQVEPRIGSVALQDMMGSIMTGLADASATKDPAYAGFAAKMLLDSVDLVEGQFTPK